VLNKLFRLYFKVYFSFLLYLNRGKLAIFDIDNTLLNTWPLRTGHLSEYEVYLKAAPFKAVTELIKDLERNGYQILFITSRRYRYYLLTVRTLLRYFPMQIAKGIILVENPAAKIYFLSKAAGHLTEKILYYDDLSYNHEHGQIKFYSDVIEQVKKLNIVYFDASYLNQIQDVEIS
jgi:FMN phosphatase YigB (HAD superfamily)